MHFSRLEDISKLEGQKPKINSEGESTLPARILRVTHQGNGVAERDWSGKDAIKT